MADQGWRLPPRDKLRERCVVCSRTVTADTPAKLLAAMVAHYDRHPLPEDRRPYTAPH